jgi:selenocysteine-specific elongation factor
MKSIIVGTAGHIDHGKTALVKALTGIDADRLEEEKRRGITIDLGFAHLELAAPSGEKLRLGFVDVPGHERFVRNMLAGVGGIDLVLLVIAADESIKPQTREHFDICRLLSVRRGITVLTKSDLVDADTLEVVKLEVEDFLRGSFLDSTQSPIVPVSALTGAGLDQLKAELIKAAGEVPARDSAALARLPIDRVFTMKGFGTVVTGTLISGTIRPEDEMEVFPTGKRVRVRGTQVHGAAAKEAIAGQRTALNLAGVSTEDLARGMMLAPPATLRGSSRVDVSLTLLPSAKPLKDRARVHLHCHTMETIAEVALVGGSQVTGVRSREDQPQAPVRNVIKPGETAYARLKLTEPALLLPGDHFILRQFSPVITIGGGLVLDAAPLRRESADRRRAFLNAVAQALPAESLAPRIERRDRAGLTLAAAIAETGLPRRVVETALNKLTQEQKIVRAGDALISSAVFASAGQEAALSVTAFHTANPLVAGMHKEALREKLRLEPAIFTALLDTLARARRLTVAGEVVHLPGRGVVMQQEESESKKLIETAFSSAGLKVPFLKDVLAGVKVDKARAQKIVTLLLREKVLVKVSEELVFHQSALADLRRQVTAYKATSPKIDVARFKDMTGITRKYAIPLLEYLDRERVTRRVGDEREIL